MTDDGLLITDHSLILSLVPAIGQVEARPCLHCASDEAVPEGASWANAALSCALFVADVRALAAVRRTAASSASVSLTRKLQKSSPGNSGGGASRSSMGRQSGGDPVSWARGTTRPHRSGDLRWGAVAPGDSSSSRGTRAGAPAAVHPLPAEGSRSGAAAGHAERRPPAAQEAAAAAYATPRAITVMVSGEKSQAQY